MEVFFNFWLLFKPLKPSKLLGLQTFQVVLLKMYQGWTALLGEFISCGLLIKEMGSGGKTYCATRCLACAVPWCNSAETFVLSSCSLWFVFLVSLWLCTCVLHGRGKPPGLAVEIWHLEKGQNEHCPESATRNLYRKKDKQGLEVWGFLTADLRTVPFPPCWVDGVGAEE